MNAPSRALMEKLPWLGSAVLALVGSACGDDQQPEQAARLYERLTTAEYRGWQRAPAYEERRESRAPHGDEVDIYINDVVARALDTRARLNEWPNGSVIVKDGFEGDDLCLVAIMEKRDTGWFFAEYDADGNTLYSGQPDLCVGCHALGDDFIRAFFLP